MSDKLSFYIWRIKVLLCHIKHDWRNVYTRVNMDGHYSGKIECSRCFVSEYFEGDF